MLPDIEEITCKYYKPYKAMLSIIHDFDDQYTFWHTNQVSDLDNIKKVKIYIKNICGQSKPRIEHRKNERKYYFNKIRGLEAEYIKLALVKMLIF